MRLLVGRVQLIVGMEQSVKRGRVPRIIEFSDDDAGLYVVGTYNSFGTSLCARGTYQELAELVLRGGRKC